MKYDDVYLMSLIKAAIYNAVPEPPSENVDWNYVYDKSVEQNIAGLIYFAMNSMNGRLDISDELADKWRKYAMTSLAYSLNQFNEFERMNRRIKEKGIFFAGLKGCMLRSLYPVPELRTMGDFDILIKKEELPDIKQIFTSAGYTVQNDYTGIICSKKNIVWEIFYSLGEEFKNNTDKWDKLFREGIAEINGISCPDSTLFFLHLIVHTGKHYTTVGAGVRNLCDITLFLNKYKDSIDFDFVEKACREQGFYKLYCHIINASHIWLDADTENISTVDTDAEGFVEYMLLYGIYGKNGNSILPQLTKNENKDESVVKKLFFPNIKSLEHRYKYLVKAPFLLPAAWFHRFISAVFRLNLSAERMIKDTRTAIDCSKVRDEWMKKLDIMD